MRHHGFHDPYLFGVRLRVLGVLDVVGGTYSTPSGAPDSGYPTYATKASGASTRGVPPATIGICYNDGECVASAPFGYGFCNIPSGHSVGVCWPGVDYNLPLQTESQVSFCIPAYGSVPAGTRDGCCSCTETYESGGICWPIANCYGNCTSPTDCGDGMNCYGNGDVGTCGYSLGFTPLFQTRIGLSGLKPPSQPISKRPPIGTRYVSTKTRPSSIYLREGYLRRMGIKKQ
jgi:hypothetical protein